MLIGLAIIVVIAAGAYAIFHKSSKTTTPVSSTSSNSSSSQTPASSSGAIVQTKNNASLGQYLADSSGNALYTNSGDSSGVSNCSGSCVSSWPVYAPTSSSASLPSNVTIIKRSDGTSQYAYKGMPLYTFSSDSSGQVTGDGLSNFHVAKP